MRLLPSNFNLVLVQTLRLRLPTTVA